MSRDFNCPACRGDVWVVDPETGQTLGKCESCAPARPGEGDAVAIRGLILERCREPGPFTVEALLRFSPFATSSAIGGVVSRLSREGVIVRVGTRSSNRPSRNGGVAAEWVAARHVAEPEQTGLYPSAGGA